MSDNKILRSSPADDAPAGTPTSPGPAGSGETAGPSATGPAERTAPAESPEPAGSARRRLRLPRWDPVPLVSRIAALTLLVLIIGVMPWLSRNDPALTILRAGSAEREATPEVLEAIRERLGLGAGPLGSLRHWLGGLVRGDLGSSWISGNPVGPGEATAFGVSVTLMATALAIALIVVVALAAPTLRDGLSGRVRQRGGVVAAVLTSLPEYLLAPVLLLVLSIYAGLLPPYGWGVPEQIVLPALSLGLPAGGYLGGLVSDSISSVFAERWVKTWTTAGLPRRALALGVLRRALAPLAGQVALVVVGLTGGAVAVEKVFAVPGLGRALLSSAMAQDVPSLQGGILLLLALALGAGVLGQLARRLLLGAAAGSGSLAAPAPLSHSGRTARVIACGGAILLAIMVAWGIGRDPYAIVARRLERPGLALPLGADALGRDVLARVAHGAVSTVLIALAVSAACFAVALLAGLVPRASTGFIEVANAAPPVLAGLVVAAVTGPSGAGAAIAVACVGWAPLAAHAAALIQEARRRPDVLLAPVLGEGSTRITLTRVLPAVMPPLVGHAALRLPGIALALAGLGFLGLGTQAPAPEWGLVLSEALPYIERAPWAVATPAAALVVLSVTAVAASRSARH